MSNEYRHNHYVPEWYQKRFLPPGRKDQELFYLDLAPRTFTDARGVKHTRKAVRLLRFRHCFAEDDLYTAKFGAADSTAIEQQVFGDIDNKGRHAVEYFSKFSHPWDGTNVFQDMLLYMSTQKLRTPKGLAWLTHSQKMQIETQSWLSWCGSAISTAPSGPSVSGFWPTRSGRQRNFSYPTIP
jgi:hypothetical protein